MSAFVSDKTIYRKSVWLTNRIGHVVKDAKRLPVTVPQKLVAIVLLTVVFSKLFDLDKNRALSPEASWTKYG